MKELNCASAKRMKRDEEGRRSSDRKKEKKKKCDFLLNLKHVIKFGFGCNDKFYFLNEKGKKLKNFVQ